MEIKVIKNIMKRNEDMAESNRALFKDKKITAINVMASPGAGKTSVILGIFDEFKENYDIAVIEGDIASDIDAQKMSKLRIPVVQINTGGGCHLDANMVYTAMESMQFNQGSLLFIENVGNLICPSVFDLGEGIKMVISSTPEGHDKPYKYTSMFAVADVILLNKVDLLKYDDDFDIKQYYDGVRAINQKAPIFEVSCKTKCGIKEIAEWILSNTI